MNNNAANGMLGQMRTAENGSEGYRIAYAKWKASVAEIEARRAEEIENRTYNARLNHINKTKQKHYNDANKAIADKAEFEQRVREAEIKLASLGLFKGSAKSAAKKVIQEFTSKAKEAEARLNEAEETYAKSKAYLDNWVARTREVIVKDVEKEFPLPEEPVDPEIEIRARREDEQRK